MIVPGVESAGVNRGLVVFSLSLSHVRSPGADETWGGGLDGSEARAATRSQTHQKTASICVLNQDINAQNHLQLLHLKKFNKMNAHPLTSQTIKYKKCIHFAIFSHVCLFVDERWMEVRECHSASMVNHQQGAAAPAREWNAACCVAGTTAEMLRNVFISPKNSCTYSLYPSTLWRQITASCQSSYECTFTRILALAASTPPGCPAIDTCKKTHGRQMKMTAGSNATCI